MLEQVHRGISDDAQFREDNELGTAMPRVLDKRYNLSAVPDHVADGRVHLSESDTHTRTGWEARLTTVARTRFTARFDLGRVCTLAGAPD
jgi:hypothetical protein